MRKLFLSKIFLDSLSRVLIVLCVAVMVAVQCNKKKQTEKQAQV